jgi:hypothetical protein
MCELLEDISHRSQTTPADHNAAIPINSYVTPNPELVPSNASVQPSPTLAVIRNEKEQSRPRS